MSGTEFNWSEFFRMGGYAFYVWWSYAITFVVLLGITVSSLTRRKKVIARVKRAIRRESMAQTN